MRHWQLEELEARVVCSITSLPGIDKKLLENTLKAIEQRGTLSLPYYVPSCLDKLPECYRPFVDVRPPQLLPNLANIKVRKINHALIDVIFSNVNLKKDLFDDRHSGANS